MQKDLEVDNQRPDEEIIFSLRQHPWVLAKSALIMVGVVLVVLLSYYFWKINNISMGVLAAAVVFSVIYLPSIWYGYINDLTIVTNQRLLKIDQKGYFYRRVSETELDNIYNINYEIKGVMKSLLNYGDIKVSTVGDEISIIVMLNIENPHYIQEKIMDLHAKYKKKIYS
jgi:hypothetical protein